MNPLLNAQNCKIYDLNSNLITKIKFSEISPGFLTLIFTSEPDIIIPKQFYLMPEDIDDHLVSMRCELLSTYSEYQVDATGSTYYVCDAATKDSTEQREDFRINVNIEVEALFDYLKAPELITIRDISAGGFLFISSRKFEKNTSVAFSFAPADPPFLVTARVMSSRPTYMDGVYAYGCQFTGLSAKTEKTIRSFVFTANSLQHRK